MDKQPPSISDIIDKLGGPTKAAAALGISNPSVVLNWKSRNSIPAQYVVAIEKLTKIPAKVIRPDIFGEAA